MCFNYSNRYARRYLETCLMEMPVLVLGLPWVSLTSRHNVKLYEILTVPIENDTTATKTATHHTPLDLVELATQIQEVAICICIITRPGTTHTG